MLFLVGEGRVSTPNGGVVRVEEGGGVGGHAKVWGKTCGGGEVEHAKCKVVRVVEGKWVFWSSLL